MLKVTPPEDDGADEEGDALELWQGRGAVRLLQRDARRRALLIDRAAYLGAGEDDAAVLRALV